MMSMAALNELVTKTYIIETNDSKSGGIGAGSRSGDTNATPEGA